MRIQRLSGSCTTPSTSQLVLANPVCGPVRATLVLVVDGWLLTRQCDKPRRSGRGRIARGHSCGESLVSRYIASPRLLAHRRTNPRNMISLTVHDLQASIRNRPTHAHISLEGHRARGIEHLPSVWRHPDQANMPIKYTVSEIYFHLAFCTDKR